MSTKATTIESNNTWTLCVSNACVYTRTTKPGRSHISLYSTSHPGSLRTLGERHNCDIETVIKAYIEQSDTTTSQVELKRQINEVLE